LQAISSEEREELRGKKKGRRKNQGKSKRKKAIKKGTIVFFVGVLTIRRTLSGKWGKKPKMRIVGKKMARASRTKDSSRDKTNVGFSR